MVWDDLRPAELKVLYHLRTLDPFGDRELDIGVREMARTLNMSHSTVSRALKVLDAKGYIELELLKVNAKVVSTGTTGVSTHQERSVGTIDDREAPLDDPEAIVEKPIPEAFDGVFHSEQNVPEQTLKTCLNNRSGATPTPAPEPLSGKGYSAICSMVPEKAGVPLNPALISVIQEVEVRHPEEAYQRVSAAVSAYMEQKQVVRNPQGFISAALRRGFTSNGAKKTARKKKTAQTTELPRVPSSAPAIADLSDLIAEISIHCQRLEINTAQALERFGRAGRSLNDLSDLDLATLRREMAGW